MTPRHISSLSIQPFQQESACCGRRYLVDFGREFQGGLRLEVSGGSPGATVSIDAGESLSQQHNRTYTGPVTQHVGSDWGYSFTWTLREGDQTIEQHEYMEFRYVSAAALFRLSRVQSS